MGDSGDEPSGTRESPMDRFLRFGAALFAVKKDELPKRDQHGKPKRPGKKAKPAPGG